MVERSAAEGHFAAIEFELNRERAAVLGRLGRKVEAAIARCHALLEDIDEGDAAALESYKAARRAALQAIDDLCFQHEMLGVFDSARVHQLYRIPPPLGDRRNDVPDLGTGRTTQPS